ncbi:Hypothetical_protein [Hexamita inflata]|uniref:Hypothetical_protein n=1 Tax=Hexamita inflata TaxID=28002 RepID=A0AA86UC02_9EUKA|nr:Hypothetical protein HINF_LOCUS23823 [Hexamita inflata]
MFTTSNDTGYEIIFQYDQAKLNKALQVMESVQYDAIEYRLTGSIASDHGILKLYINKFDHRFNPHQRSIKFPCGQILGKQQKTCYEMINTDYFTYSISTYNLDIIFYSQRKLVYLIKANKCKSTYTCWESGVAIIRQNIVTIQLLRNHYCDGYNQYYDFTNVTTTLKIYNENYEFQYMVTQHLPIINSTNINQFNFTCEKIQCSKLTQTSIFVLDLHLSYFQEEIEINKVQFIPYYSTAQIATLITGSILLLIIIYVYKKYYIKTKIKIREYSGLYEAKKLTEIERLILQLHLKINK